MKRLDTSTFGPWAMITGASSGIGEEFARQLAASGLHLVLVARRLSALETLGSELAHTFGIQYRAVGLDLTTNDVLDTLSEATHNLDIGLVISNAGTMTSGDFLLIDHQLVLRDLRLNVQAHLDLTHHFGQSLAQEVLFLTEVRQPLTQNSLTLLFARLNQRAGLAPSPIRPAMLRDTYALRFLQAGGDLPMLQEQLGLADPVSVRRYQRFCDEQRRLEAGVQTLSEEQAKPLRPASQKKKSKRQKARGRE